MKIINIEHLSKTYKSGKIALNDISLQVEENTLFGLLGVNGAGKTTLIKILSGLLKKDTGKVTMASFSLDDDIDEIQKIINISPQETSIAPNLTVKENLIFFSEIYECLDLEYIDKIIKIFNLQDVEKQKAKTLSGGYKRRLSIAISLVSHPIILFLDEPTLGLDILARRELWKIINSLKNKITIILTSHYLEEIESLCDQVAILVKGKVVCYGSVQDIKKIGKSDSFENAFINIVEEGEKNENDSLC